MKNSSYALTYNIKNKSNLWFELDSLHNFSALSYKINLDGFHWKYTAEMGWCYS